MFWRKKKPPAPRKRENRFELVNEYQPPKIQVLENARARFIIQRERAAHLLPWGKMAITLLLILVVGVGIGITHAWISGVQREINLTTRQLRAQQQENEATRSLMDARYTLYEIEHIATTQLGMTHPDPSQMKSIYVPRGGGVILNHDDPIMETPNHFWQGVQDFFNGIMAGIFGGD
jgi:cell division protein FtsL